MAAELVADLAEGASPEDVLGNDATDPRAFAAAWAAERDVIPRRRSRAQRVVLGAALVLALAAIAGVVLLAGAPSDGTSVRFEHPIASGQQQVWVGPPARLISVPTPSIEMPRLAVLTKGDSGNVERAVGLALSIAGLGGLLAVTLIRFGSNGRARSGPVALNG
jgi:hypothetical protein